MAKHNAPAGRRGLTFLICVLSMPACAKILEGVTAQPPQTAVLAGTLLGLAYLLLRPLLRLLTFPIGCVTLGLSGFVIDCALILLMDAYVPGFSVDGILWAALCAALVDGLCLIVGGR